jgi:metal-responsive CopG/Arc/MetJ family transcriptional regulator
MAKVKLDDELWARVKDAAARAGYASPEELVSHAVEKELATLGGNPEDEEEIKKRLQGLGYIS